MILSLLSTTYLEDMAAEEDPHLYLEVEEVALLFLAASYLKQEEPVELEA